MASFDLTRPASVGSAMHSVHPCACKRKPQNRGSSYSSIERCLVRVGTGNVEVPAP
eukprot:COSAG02_NODE_18250_length_951_cov_0.848592_2_plen_55_part_01